MRPDTLAFICVVMAIVAVSAPLEAQTDNASTRVEVRKRATALRVPHESVRIDGRLDDEVWRRALFISDFIQKEPVEGAEPAERTELAILYDEGALYVGARMFADDPAEIRRAVGRRDGTSLHQSEHVWVSFDTYLDRRTAYSFGISASSVRMDWYHASDNEYQLDMSFDPVWEGEAQIDSLGWTFEMRIPFSQLRFRPGDEQVWGFNVNRWIPSRNEDVFWIPVPRSETGWSSRMGDLVGIGGIRPSVRMELLPYAASSARISSESDAGNPFNPDGRTVEARAGGDLKMGLGPNLTLEATVNPDFGQVEADPAVVNLSAFETFFEERRPFFTEGSQLLRGNGPSYFYSRRIGAAPRGGASGDYVDRPANTTILGATKLTGRLASGLSVGALAALTSRENATTYDTSTLETRSVEIAPAAGYGVLRLQQEFGPDASTAGLMFTAVRRDVENGTVLGQLLTKSALTGGLDWNLRFGRGAYSVSGYAGFSYVEGDSFAIQRLQLGSARYYQRPDQDYVSFDPSRRSLLGYTAGLFVSRNSGRHWLWNVSFGAESPGMELNDAGRIVTADGRTAFGTLTYRETRPGRALRNYSVLLNSGGEWNFGGDRQFSTTRMDALVTWKNQWTTSATFWVDHRAQDQRLTRGGPSAGTPMAWVAIAQLTGNSAARTQWRGRAYYGRDELDGLTYRLSGGLTVRPAPRWSLSFSPNYLRSRTARQYVGAIGDSLASITFGARYIFATIDETQWSVPIRFNYAFTPDLTLEVHAAPFLASGRWYGHGELPAPRALGIRVYGEAPGTSATVFGQDSVVVTDGASQFTLPGLDFNVTSLRSNVVLRWEWRPGSSLFLVWQQNRDDSESVGDHVRIGDLFKGLSARGDSFFAVKISYWLAPR